VQWNDVCDPAERPSHYERQLGHSREEYKEVPWWASPSEALQTMWPGAEKQNLDSNG